MTINRRQALGLTAGAIALAAVGLPGRHAWATPEETQKRIAEFTGGKTPETGRLTLTAPEIAENGNTVPVSIEVESAMEGDEHFQKYHARKLDELRAAGRLEAE